MSEGNFNKIKLFLGKSGFLTEQTKIK